MSDRIGEPLSRIDGQAKVTGRATYAAEFELPDLAHASLVLSTIPHGRVSALDSVEAERQAGVYAVLTHQNAPRLPYRQFTNRPVVDPKAGDQLKVFQGPEVLFSGQPIAAVIADSLEHARQAAALVHVEYEAAVAATHFDMDRAHPPSPATARAGRPGEAARGNADRALADSPFTVDAVYIQAREHHNAMEPHATIAYWQDGKLTLYDKTQWVDNDRAEIAHVFGISEDDIRVISPYVGGAFGSALRTWPHVTIAALAARQTGRPVRLELSRRELYTAIGFRPHTLQRVALGAKRNGELKALIQEATAQTSQYEEYAELTLEPAQITYSCPNVRSRFRLVEMHTNTPCPMRAPGIATGTLGLEIAMDELAVALDMDPLDLRLRNYAERDEDKNLPWSRKELRACYHAAAERFGWNHHSPKPRPLPQPGPAIGCGMATAVYPSHRSSASASVALAARGPALVRTAASDMGPGTYTSIAQIAADTLGLRVEDIRVSLGDTDLPKAPVHGGSITTASVGNAVRSACEAVRTKILNLIGESPDSSSCPDYANILRQRGLDSLEASARAVPENEQTRFSNCAFGAVFAEVLVNHHFGTVQVTRIVGAYDAGRIINPKIARSQLIGGMVGGIGMALFEEADWDPVLGRVMNANLAEYLVPVNADIGELEAILVASDDRSFNPLGVKGLAELALCGVAPAIANAVYNATGKRIREFPIKPEKLLSD